MGVTAAANNYRFSYCIAQPIGSECWVVLILNSTQDRSSSSSPCTKSLTEGVGDSLLVRVWKK